MNTRHLVAPHATERGFTLVELLVVVAVIAVISAAAIPTYVALDRQGHENASKLALMQARENITATLPAWRGYPPTGLLAICLDPADVNDYLFGEPTINACAEGRYNALTRNGVAPSPTINGDLPAGVLLTGVVGSTGDFCLSAVHDTTPTPFHITNTESEPSDGTCASVGWRPESTSTGSDATSDIGANATTVTGLTVTNDDTTATTARITWNSTPGTTYEVLIDGFPAHTVTATTSQTSCVLPTYPYDCTSTTPSGTLGTGTYTASVRARTATGLSPGATATFTNPISGTVNGATLPFPKSRLHILQVAPGTDSLRLPTAAATIEYIDFGNPATALENVPNNGSWTVNGTTVRALFDWDNSTGIGDLDKITNVTQFGRNSQTGSNRQIANGVGAFEGMQSVTWDALPTLDTSNLTSTERMFKGSPAFNQDISDWDVSGVTNMIAMFQNASAFNQDLHTWDVTDIPTTPANFANGATAWTKNQPKFGFTRDGNWWYQVVNDPATPVAAALAANTAGGWLPVPASGSDNTWLRNLANDDTIPLGLADATTEGLWVVVGGPDDGATLGSLPYSNWGPGEPANTDPGTDYAALTPTGDWVATTNTPLNRYVIVWQP